MVDLGEIAPGVRVASLVELCANGAHRHVYRLVGGRDGGRQFDSLHVLADYVRSDGGFGARA